MAERCDVCGFEWEAIGRVDVPRRLVAATEGLRIVMATGDAALKARPQPEVWSPVEYACHVRDVLLNLRDRIVVGLAEDNPTPKPMYAAVRLASGIYADEEPAALALEVAVAGALLARTVAALDDAQLARPIFYPWPTPATRTLLWVAAQALHEAEHHLDDVQRLRTPTRS